MQRSREDLEERFWQLIEPDPHAFTRMIGRLLGYVSTAELAEIVKDMEGTDAA